MTVQFAKAGLDENGLYYGPIDRARRGHSDEVWLRAREAYKGGLSTQVACERAGVSRSALFERAKKEGWRRPGPRGWISDEEMAEAAAAPPLSYHQAAEEAWEQASLALRIGRLAEAAAWTRLHRQYRQMVKEAEARELRRLDGIRRDYDAFVRGIQVEGGLERAQEELQTALESGDSDVLDRAVAASFAELRARLHEATGAFIDTCGPSARRSAASRSEPDSPDSPDRFSQSADAGSGLRPAPDFALATAHPRDDSDPETPRADAGRGERSGLW